ncbi:MAG: M24 family metallopeptidase [Methanobacteriaceae archaeon]
MNSNLNSIINKMHNENFDSILLSQNTNIFYISGFYPSSTSFLLLKENPILFVSKMDMESAKNANDNKNIELRELKSISNIKNTIESEIINNNENNEGNNNGDNSSNNYNIGIEATLTIGTYNKLKGNFNLATTNLINNARMIKSKEELSNIEKALDIATKSFLELCEGLGNSNSNSNFNSNSNIGDKQNSQVSEKAIEYELVNTMGINGAECESFDTIVAIGSKSSLPHSDPSFNKTFDINNPEIVLFDWGAKYNGYCSDTSRTIVYSENEEEIFDIVLEAHDKAIAAAKPGVACSDIDKVARDIITEYGFGDNFIHSTGHGVGLDIHELPNISSRNNNNNNNSNNNKNNNENESYNGDTVKEGQILQENMVITIEPGIYLEGEFGVRIEDMVCVGKNPKVMGNLAQKLYI